MVDPSTLKPGDTVWVCSTFGSPYEITVVKATGKQFKSNHGTYSSNKLRTCFITKNEGIEYAIAACRDRIASYQRRIEYSDIEIAKLKGSMEAN